jgi:hypothetical protein
MTKKIDPTAAPDLSNHTPPGIVTFTEAELEAMDPTERDIAQHMMTLAAEGIDPTLDQAEIDAIRAQRAATQQKTAQEIAAQPEPGAKPEEAPSTPEQVETPAAVVATPSDDGLQLLPVGDIAGMENQRAQLRKQERELNKKWVDGELEQDAYDAQLSELQTQIDGIGDNIGAARALQQQNQLMVEQHQQATINAIRMRGAEIGLDYGQTETAQAFDTAMDLVATLPANAELSFAQLAEKAHAMVAAMHGATQPAPAPAVTKAATPRVPPPAPRTLGKIPAAEIPNQGSQAQDLGESLFAGKSAAEAEAEWEKLTPAQRNKLLGAYA